MKKQIVHIVDVNRSGEKLQIQIKLPLNTKRITQLKITASPEAIGKFEVLERKGKPIRSVRQEVGWLWLRIPEQRDVFFAEIVQRPLPFHNQTIPNHRPVDDFGNGSFWTQGKKEEFYSVCVDVTTNIVEGFYVDRMTTKGSKYQLKIYLTLEI